MRSFFIFVFGLCFCTSAFLYCNQTGELKVGLLLPMTGEMSFQGKAQSQALQVAKNDLDHFFSNLNAPYSLKLELADTESNPEVALKRMQQLAKEGISIFIGPSSTAELLACRQFAKNHNLIMLTPSASGSQMAMFKPNVVQMLPNDEHQSQALATLMLKEGIKVVVTIGRGDEWGDAFLKSFKKNYEKLGGLSFSHIRYNPKTTIFENQLKYLQLDLERATAEYTPNSIGVFLMGFEESAALLSQAPSPLKHYKWFASDTLRSSQSFLQSSKAQDFAVSVRLRSPQYEIPEYAKLHFQKLLKQLPPQNKSINPTLLAASYDALTLIAHSFPWVQHAPHLRLWYQALEYQSANTLGTTGWLGISPDGVRALASYSFWEMEKANENYQWISRNTYQKQSPLSETNGTF